MILIYIIGVIGNCVVAQHQDSHSPSWNDDEDAFLQTRKVEVEIGVEDSETSLGLEQQQQQTSEVLQRLADRVSNPEAIQEAMASLGLSNYSLALVEFGTFHTTGNTTASTSGWNKLKTNISNNWEAEDGTGEMFAAAGLVFTSLGSILGKAISGQGVTKGDWINLAEQTCQAVVQAGVAALVVGLSAVSGGLLGLLGSLIGGLITALFQLTAETPPTTGDLINRALAKERLDENKDFWLGLSEEMQSLSTLFVNTENTDNTDAKTAWYMIMQHDLSVNRHTVFGDCLDSSTWSGDTCKKYIEDGMLEVMLPYAESHMSMLWELLMLFMENPSVDIAVRQNQVDILHARLQELGAEYHAALKNAWDIYYPWRMSMIWSPFMQNVTTTYSWWNADWTYDIPASGKDIYHPFDFLHAHTDNGYNDLDTEFPIDRSTASYSNDWNDIRPWAYEGCWGAKHDDVENEKHTANHACNLYEHITSADGCNCTGSTSKTWFDEKVDLECWSGCMDAYIAKVDSEVNTAFGAAINEFQSFLQNLSFPQKWKAVVRASGTQCDDSSLIDTAHCEDAFNYIGESYAGTTQVSDSSVPAGCSLRFSDNHLVINSADDGESHADYKPLCGAMFFASRSDTLVLNAQMSKGEALTSEDGSVKLNMQSDGNLVIYDADQSAKWSTSTAGNADAHVQFDYPGNLVVYSAEGASLWSTGEQQGATKLVLQNNCSLDIISIHGDVVWSSNSSC